MAAAPPASGDDTLVDVLIPAYNVERTVRGAVASILDQEHRALRVIVVDDGSTDGTGAILEAMAREDARITLIRTANRGIVDALNTALAHATAAIIARHDADDLAYPQRFGEQLRYLAAHPDCVAVGANARHIDAEGRPIGRTALGGEVTGDHGSVPAHEPYIMHPLLMARADAVRAIGGYRHARHCEDSDLYWRLLGQGRLFNLAGTLADYRIHAGSVTSRSLANVRVGAVFSQLSAASAARRARGAPDLVLGRDMGQRMQAAPDLDAMVAIAGELLDVEERRHLGVATAAKMLELRIYRVFRFQRSDLRFIVREIALNLRHLDARTLRHLLAKPIHYARPRNKLRALLKALRLHRLASRL